MRFSLFLLWAPWWPAAHAGRQQAIGSQARVTLAALAAWGGPDGTGGGRNGSDKELRDLIKKEAREEVDRLRESEIKDARRAAREEARRQVEEDRKEIENSTEIKARKDMEEPTKRRETISKTGQRVLDAKRGASALIVASSVAVGLALVTGLLLLMAFEWDVKDIRTESTSSRSELSGLMAVILRRKHVLLLIIPIVALLRANEGSKSALFILSFFMILGLAVLVESVMQDVALRSSPWFVSLALPAVTSWLELSMILQSIFLDDLSLAKGSLLGFLLHSLLFSIGLIFIVGTGTEMPLEVSMDRVVAHTQLLVMFALLIMGINAFVVAEGVTPKHEMSISVFAATIMVGSFVSMVAFLVCGGKSSVPQLVSMLPHQQEEPLLSGRAAFALLLLAAVGVYTGSAYMVEGMDPFANSMGLSYSFVSVILFPFATGSAELIVCLVLVRRGGQSLGVALELILSASNSTSYFVIPLAVLISSLVPGESISLNFTSLYSGTLASAVFLVYVILSHPHWDWWRGLLLVSFYMIAAALFFFMPDKSV